MRAPAATTSNETRLFIPCDDDQLSAVFTTPTAPANGTVILFFAGRWSVTSIGRSRVFVHLSRQLAGLGYHSLRIDFLGLGESTGQERQWKLDEPFTREPAAAVRWLEEQGFTDVILIGTCGGARLALDAGRALAALRGVVLLSPPVRDYQKGNRTATLPTGEFVRQAFSKKVIAGLFESRTRRRYLHHARGKIQRVLQRRKGGAAEQPQFEWVSRNTLNPLEEIVKRGVPVMFFVGDLDSYYEDFERGRSGRLGKLMDRAGDLIRLIVIEGKYHGLAEADVQRLTQEAIEAWLPSIAAPTAARAAAG